MGIYAYNWVDLSLRKVVRKSVFWGRCVLGVPEGMEFLVGFLGVFWVFVWSVMGRVELSETLN